jgi:primary-amine oxidase
MPWISVITRYPHCWTQVLCFALCSLMTSQGIAAEPPNTAHPLDPLSKEEITATVAVLKASGKVSDSSRFPIIVLREPPKDEVLNFKPGGAMRREAFTVIYERASNTTSEAVVDLNNKSILSWQVIPGVQPAVMFEEFFLVPDIVRADPRWQEAMVKRGITDFDQVQIDPWSAGYYGLPDEDGIRVVRGLSYYRGSAQNAYARPIEGVIAYVNLNTRQVFKLVDTGVVPVPQATVDFDVKTVGNLRAAPKALHMVQPRGVSFDVQGFEVRWQHWRFRYGLHPREGLVLYTVGYEDQGSWRSVLYRASLSEMFVPYGDPGPAWFFRNVFDMGEYGAGLLTNPLEPFADAPDNAVFFPAVFADNTGTPSEMPRIVALYERDGGLLWKHFDLNTVHNTTRNESRRARQLVLGIIATVGNYDYGFNWVFHLDGTLEIEVLLSGIMQTKGIPPAGTSAQAHGNSDHGHMVAKQLAAVHHQHFFNFRLDLDVDGTGNSVVEMNTAALPAGPNNPYLGAFVMQETVLHTEQEAQRQLNLASNRNWKVINPSVKNGLGQLVGYMLVPGENAVSYAAPTSAMRQRAGFLNAHLWVTPYDPVQMNAAGYYINQSKGGEGLPKWTSANRAIENQDIVVWYTMGTTHIPRPEEWPVMPVHRLGFRLMPNGFFARNPALDVPKSE